MNFRWPSVPFLFVLAAFGAVHLAAQSTSPAQTGVPAAVAAPAYAGKIVTKDPVYLKLLDPPKDSAYFQTYSQSYKEAFADINSKFIDITDATERTKARNDEWVKVMQNDNDKFQYEADAGYRDAKIAYAESHRDSWLPIGPLYYDENNKVLRAKPYANAPIVASLRVPMQPADLQKLYDKYHLLVADEIDRRAHDYVAKAGPGSNCARNPDFCYKFSYQDIEENMRANRIVAFAAGDLEAGRVDRLFLADYESELQILDLDAASAGLAGIAWRFAPGPAPVKPAEPALHEPAAAETASAQPQTAPVAAPSADIAGPPSQNAAPAAAASPAAALAPTSSASGSAMSAATPTPEKPPLPPVVVPANVTAAAIVTQTKPEYPQKARAKLVQGEVLLQAIINKEGKISEVHVLSGDDLLTDAAVEAVRHWEYKPMLVNGEPREVETTITVTFALKD
jgi:protein TonB